MKIFRPFLVVISSLVLLFMVAILLFMLANSMLSPRREMNGSDWHYYQDIVALIPSKTYL